MKPEKQNLIHDLLDQDSSRETTLAAGHRILRQRRHWRTTRQVVLVALLAAASVFYLTKDASHPQVYRVARPASTPQVQALTDDQLLALFPNTPVGIASLSNGKKRLIFPRPGDEQRFIKRL